ncbi:hypothetical protein K2173_020326 [Erythroxylum novogranatense]|uniref:Uncharacterized protein n=1 Tax=Erythroxylum novogranatense TaxID=1862640 RepID=A0AAV8U7I3_9ROSI|nr:hypothetical protein K2173_020326 [Erythroxylum novogranatense]
MGLFIFTIAGGGFILIGAWESLVSSISCSNTQPSLSLSQLSKARIESNPKPEKESNFSTLTYVFVTVFSFLFIVNSLISLFSAINARDGIGSALQLQILAVAFLFLLFAIMGVLSNSSGSVRFPPSLINFILLFGFVEEFLLYYLQRKDTAGVENRYFDLMLVPITICVVSTIMELKSPLKGNEYARLARGIGLVLQGTWFVQMGISFYSDWIVQGCTLHEKSRGNYSIKCGGMHEYHRGKGIATLLFNCHLALLVVLLTAVYSVMVTTKGDPGAFMQYKPLEEEIQQGENGHFTLDSDEEEIREEGNVPSTKGAIVGMTVNGHGSH